MYTGHLSSLHSRRSCLWLCAIASFLVKKSSSLQGDAVGEMSGLESVGCTALVLLLIGNTPAKGLMYFMKAGPNPRVRTGLISKRLSTQKMWSACHVNLSSPLASFRTPKTTLKLRCRGMCSQVRGAHQTYWTKNTISQLPCQAHPGDQP